MWKPLSPEQATPIVRRRLLCNLAPPPHVQLLFDSTRWPASPEVQDRLTGDSDYEYSQSQYPKSWVGKCLILVAQWLQHSACNWDVMSCCPTISWNSYQLALFERQLTVQQSKLWVLLSWVFGSSPVIYLNAVCLGGFRTHYGALVCSDILRVLVNPIMIIFRHQQYGTCHLEQNFFTHDGTLACLGCPQGSGEPNHDHFQALTIRDMPSKKTFSLIYI